MNKKEKLLAAYLLELASNEFAMHICTDLDMEALGWDVEERRDLMRRMHENNGDPEEFDPNCDYKYNDDWWVMIFLAKQLKKEANESRY